MESLAPWHRLARFHPSRPPQVRRHLRMRLSAAANSASSCGARRSLRELMAKLRFA